MGERAIVGALTAIALAGCGDAGAAGDDVRDPDASTTGDGGAAFVLEVHTALEGGVLMLRTNLPARDVACAALSASGAPCGDVDLDGLTDAWEDVALDRLRPLLRFDEGESFEDDAAAHVADIGRVAPGPGDPLEAVVIVVQAYSIDYGSCGLTGHDGDPERVALHVTAVAGGGPGDVAVTAAYTAAHEGTASDHGRMFAGADLAMLVHADVAPGGEPRWVVFPSRNKHATYATVDICENISPFPCFDEDCDGGGDLLPDVINAGEDGARRVEDLTGIGFPSEDAWADQPFCGGIDSTSCSATVREKLLSDPFGVLE